MVPRLARLAWVVGLLAATFAAYQGRRAFIRTFFVDGAPGPAPRLGGDLSGPGLSPAARTRVVLIDGLGERTARALPALDALCARGLDLRVDAGFPTVSLPEQHVLWTGLTQQQSGIAFRLGFIATPPADSLPRRVPGSVAVAESHPEIVGSFGFTEVAPIPDAAAEAELAAWRAGGFAAAARTAVTGPAPLAFVHVLAVDVAGHRQGAASARYAEVAAGAVALAAGLVDAERAAHPDGGTRWFVLSDHGHLPRGGHGGIEEEIRLVRGCVLGAGVAQGSGRVHMVDVSRMLADSLGLPPAAAAAGRPLAAALAHPAIDGTLPFPAPWRWALAALLLAAGLALTLRAARGFPTLWPYWWLVAYGGIVVLRGLPSLSQRGVFSKLGLVYVEAALPGLAVLLVTAWLGRRAGPARQVAALLALPLAALLACLALSLDRPPLVPVWTAHASACLLLLATGSAALAPAVLVAAVRRSSGRSGDAAGRDTPPVAA